ncbi:hypothetical protein LJ737_09940 [Hymenobacter sp. 15J16-1T3B]|uniref:hypothetical protein n=1 Tax=Hymenobacter sp. 15J16-1T3B TaxID=2886941 RepID=UPI001D0F9D99|nr:hypothetical protein [Hymenobacter sp. 15J16-1T3B]MCC3157561.1 hypothetical protein [Hymenobacter sp. 15J16-1T3B]
MLTSSRVLSAALLLLPLAACDNSWSPGVDHTNNDSFARAPRATRVDTERDSVSGGGKAYRPVGTGSLARSSAEALSMQPGGDPNTSKYTESGTTDGSSTTSGRSLTNRGTSNTEVPGTTRGPATGTGEGRGTLNNAPRETNANAASQNEQGNAPKQTNQRNQRGNSAQN